MRRFFAKEQAGTLKQTDVYLFRVAAMLDDFAVHGAVLRRYSRTVGKLPATRPRSSPGSGVAAGGRRRVSTVRSYGTVAGEFLAFTGTRGGLAALDAGVIGAFVATLAGYQAKTVEQKLCALRSFLRFAAGDGLVDAARAGGGPGGEVDAGRPGSRRYGTRATWPGSWRRSTGATRAGNAITRSSC